MEGGWADSDSVRPLGSPPGGGQMGRGRKAPKKPYRTDVRGPEGTFDQKTQEQIEQRELQEHLLHRRPEHPSACRARWKGRRINRSSKEWPPSWFPGARQLFDGEEPWKDCCRSSIPLASSGMYSRPLTSRSWRSATRLFGRGLGDRRIILESWQVFGFTG